MKIDIRKATDDDVVRFKECLALDDFHAKQDADEWLTPPGEFMVFFDEEGNRMWVRIEKVLRISLQHDPQCSRKAIISIMYRGFSWLQGMARNNGFSSVIFESRASRLIQFLQKLFGFERLEENYHLCVVRQEHKRI